MSESIISPEYSAGESFGKDYAVKKETLSNTVEFAYEKLGLPSTYANPDLTEDQKQFILGCIKAHQKIELPHSPKYHNLSTPPLLSVLLGLSIILIIGFFAKDLDDLVFPLIFGGSIVITGSYWYWKFTVGKRHINK
jgi:hypothetical protein